MTEPITVLIPGNVLQFKPVGATPKRMIDHGNGYYSVFEGQELKDTDVVKVLLVISL